MSSFSQPTPISRFSYTSPEFFIDDVRLTFDLSPTETVVTAELKGRRNQEVNSAVLKLVGSGLELIYVKLDGKVLSDNAYVVNDTQLQIFAVPEIFTVETQCRIHPARNTELMGLYVSDDIFCTQCEPEGFRKITYYLDRPDVLAKFTVRINADPQQYPVLLSNGNLVEQKQLADGRHQATWVDPFPKPSYLFALVAGKLQAREEEYTTMSGKPVRLQIFTQPEDFSKSAFAMRALIASMRWDEKVYGREYDLEQFMIVAIHDFNMGAMENKGLNIFNAKYILADPATATDQDYENILSVVAHEYFHNWTGNRVTCRDWFQLSLKEGLTIFRDQSFSRDQSHSVLSRINDVRVLRTQQFSEDAGPLSHPVRPDSYIEMNNFYTTTVYNKGAEVVRMLHTLLGPEKFRRGMDLYFERNDGRAVTIEDFLSAHADANDVDLTQFSRWYATPGTPTVTVTSSFDQATQCFTLHCIQTCTKAADPNTALLIPIRYALYDRNSNAVQHQGVLQLKQLQQDFEFRDVTESPYVSLLQDFSAPIILKADISEDDLTYLAQHDDDEFNRYAAWTDLLAPYLLKAIAHPEQPVFTAKLHEIFAARLIDKTTERGLLSALFRLPDEAYIREKMAVIDPLACHDVFKRVQLQLSVHHRAALLAAFELAQQQNTEVGYSPSAAGLRRWLAVLLSYLAALGRDDASCLELAYAYYNSARTMTEKLAALQLLLEFDNSKTCELIASCFNEWQDDALLLDKWFSLQASADRVDAHDVIKRLRSHPQFNLQNPNRVRAVFMSFAKMNPAAFHAADGSGYHLLRDLVLELDPINPHLAARLAEVFSAWARFIEPQRSLQKQALEHILATPKLSRDLAEIVTKSLG